MIHHLVLGCRVILGDFFDGKKVSHEAGNTECMCVCTYLGASLMAVTTTT